MEKSLPSFRHRFHASSSMCFMKLLLIKSSRLINDEIEVNRGNSHSSDDLRIVDLRFVGRQHSCSFCPCGLLDWLAQVVVVHCNSLFTYGHGHDDVIRLWPWASAACKPALVGYLASIRSVRKSTH